jgi:hypothetical protein
VEDNPAAGDHVKVPVPDAVNCAVPPSHIAEGLATAETLGVGTTVTVIVVEPVQPAASEPEIV